MVRRSRRYAWRCFVGALSWAVPTAQQALPEFELADTIVEASVPRPGSLFSSAILPSLSSTAIDSDGNERIDLARDTELLSVSNHSSTYPLFRHPRAMAESRGRLTIAPDNG